MHAPDQEALSASLGPNLDEGRKRTFLSAAATTLASALEWPDERIPTRDDFDSLRDIVQRAKDLHRSLTRASTRGLPAEYLREAWKQRARVLARPIAPASEDYPDFDDLLFQLAQSALWLIDELPAHRQDTTWGQPGMLATMLADDFYQAFGEPPATGSGSPFVRFCERAFPTVRLKCPSPPTLGKIVRRTLGAPTGKVNRPTR